ncbi:uncharacterized protein LOC133178248 [Saccostrea echinata]|uniref:uncharacterized protein LOC133178248 n=1 Tax=Saccostrea echinata TaxID=191078 RepID=UPI002A814368|nr:uncharacterized protein LOC133178248 [Saccostrea echinata]
MSESVFMGLCRKLGTSQLVAMRRETEDIYHKVVFPSSEYSVLSILSSGSMKEGFRQEGSDFDYMLWFNEYKVIWNLPQSQIYRRESLILANCTNSPPGFALLQPLTPFLAYEFISSSCIRKNSRLYISSSKYKQNMSLRERQYMGGHCFLHGPCTSGMHQGEPFDNAHCFSSDFWPPAASSWIDRCNTWPRPHVVQEIVKKGCHLVAIGHKLGKHEDEEWRISFSFAEQRLVFEFNHSQFLVYGLLKMLSKEIFHKLSGDEGKLLCSYHMKTAVFWVIQQNTISFWCPQNLLECFWVCFKLILKWVYEGVCPNFFIPKNNMFLHNIYGEAQKNLFNNLYELHQKGIAFLLHSPSIRSYITDALYNFRLPICTDERILISEVEFDVELFNEINKNYGEGSEKLLEVIPSVRTVEQLIGSPLTNYQVIMLQREIANKLQTTAFILHKMYMNSTINKLVYVSDKMSCYMVKLAAKFGFISDTLYIAMHYYNTLRYTEALSVIKKIKLKLAQPYIMRHKTVYEDIYTAAVGGEAWSTKMRQAVAMQIKLGKNCYINELIPEIQFSKLNGEQVLNVGDLIMLHMLEILCYIHLDRTRAQTVLNDLQFFVNYNERGVAAERIKDISWQILGICQQATGNHRAALFSYQQSLRQEPFHKIQQATLMRIQSLYSDL